MAVNWGLAQPQGGFLDALKAYDVGRQMSLQQREQQRQDQQRAALTQAYDPMTGRMDPTRTREALVQSGDFEGLAAYTQSLQGEQQLMAKKIGQLAQAAQTPEQWDQAIDWLTANGEPDAEQYRGQFSPEMRRMAMALGGVQDAGEEAYTLGPGQVRMRGGEVLARSPYKPEVITAEDGSKFVYNPNGETPPAPGGGTPDLNKVFDALIWQESRGRPGILGPKTPYGQAVGMTQMLPGTAKQMAEKLGVPWRPHLMRGASPEAAQYQKTLGRAYFDEGLQKYGGDVEKALMYYHGGPNENIWGRRTRRYASEVLARAGSGGVEPGGVKPLTGPKPKDAPSGYRWKNDGTLEPIRGGPADPAANNRQFRKEAVALRKEFNALPEVKDFKDVRANFKQVEALGSKPQASPQDDIALVFSYMKMLDPGSVVREGEFATAQNAAGVPDQIRNLYQRVLEGNRLNPQQRKNMVATAGRVYVQRRDTYNRAAEQYRGYASDSDIDPDSVARRYIPTKQAPKAGGASGFKVLGRRKVQ